MKKGLRSGTALLVEACEFAAMRHEGQERKSAGVPYISHPAAVAAVVASAGGSVEAQAAGVLHDVVEDTPTTDRELRSKFGETIAGIVREVSEPDKSLSWESRKRHTLETLETLSPEGRLVLLADKLTNVVSLGTEIEQQGEEKVWSRMKGTRAQQCWYYAGIARGLGRHDGLGEEYAQAVERLFDTRVPHRGQAQGTGPEPCPGGPAR